MTKDEFKGIVTMLTCAYSNFEIKDKMTFDIWYHALKDLKFEKLKASTVEHIKTIKYQPTIAALRELTIPKKNKNQNFKGSQWTPKQIYDAIKRKQMRLTGKVERNND